MHLNVKRRKTEIERMSIAKLTDERKKEKNRKREREGEGGKKEREREERGRMFSAAAIDTRFFCREFEPCGQA
jgi:hypothetical protein